MSAAGGIGPQGDDGLQPRAGFTITPADATDLSATVTKGLLVTTAGSLVWKYVETLSTQHTMAVVVGQYVPGHIGRVMTATTAAVIGLGG